MKTFKTLITEVSLLTEGPAEKLFGKILFAQGRREDPKREPKLKAGKYDEPDTKFEKKAWETLRMFFFGYYDKKSTKKAFDAFDTLEKHKKDFSKILNPPRTIKEIYRGTKIPLKDIRNKAWTKKGPDFKTEYEYSPRSNLQSWSTDRGTAEWFMRSRRPKKKGKVAGLLVLKTAGAQKLLFNPKWINKHFTSAAGGEDEIVRVTKTPVTVTLVIDSDMFKKALDGEDPLKWFK
mgnify:CR=1 FL=1